MCTLLDAAAAAAGESSVRSPVNGHGVVCIMLGKFTNQAIKEENSPDGDGISVMLLTPGCTGRLSKMPELNWTSAEDLTSAGDFAAAAPPEDDASDARNVEPSIEKRAAIRPL